MRFEQLLTQVAKLQSSYKPGETITPTPELIAFSVRLHRKLAQLKKEAFASMAGVSLSTLERIENAKVVSVESLDKIALAMGGEPGHFTAPREVQSPDAGLLGNVKLVAVKHITTQPQVRELARCQSFMVNAPDCEHLNSQISKLVSWLDLASGIVGPHASLVADLKSSDDPPRRDLYKQILDVVRTIEKEGATVLGGELCYPQHGISDWKTALLNITRKDKDPAASKRKFVFFDLRLLSG